MRQVGALEAESQFASLLTYVEHGGEVAITRQGREVARLVPARAPTDRARALAAAQRSRERATALSQGAFDWAEWKAWRDSDRP